jgi:hypothetical protein
VEIAEKHIKEKKRIGTLGGAPVIEVLTKGGLWLVVGKKNNRPETLGTGPHRAVARYIAQKLNPDMVVTELSKSDHVDEASILSVFDVYRRKADLLTDLMNRE